MFERFTDRARRVIVLAQEQARTLNHNYIGTEHLLLALIQEGEGVAARALALTSSGITLDVARQAVVELIGEGQQVPSGHIPFTPRCRKVLELGLREALQLGHSYIGTEHLLLALVRHGDGMGVQVLAKLGVSELNDVRKQVLKILAANLEMGAAKSAADAGTAIGRAVGRNELNRDEMLFAHDMAFQLGYPSARAFLTKVTREEFDGWMARRMDVTPPQSHATASLSDALRDLAPRVHEDISRTEHTATEDKVTGEVVETLTVRWKRREGSA